ncbi:Ribonuclease H-like domain containing protein [Quillaja saponaria]|uniref:Ribonuclease H-like domain containing protein n=1 Tax=Quillaja saponaria TaxID=32244 RepID=A0AAD7LJN5_QUISA|nr:Ribonuclease H-like domain containing protein [Quillaja saponaria]
MPNPDRICFQLRKRYDELVKISSPSHKASLASSWSPPPAGWIKVNFGVASSSNCSWVAAIARDYHGHLLISATAQINTLSSSLAVAEACKLASSIHQSIACSSYIIQESDNLNVISSLNNLSCCPDWELEHAIHDSLFSLSFAQAWVARKVTYSANVASHNLAKWASCNFVSGNVCNCMPDLNSLNSGVLMFFNQ